MAAVVVLMAVFWITEALPIAVTALLPLALYPLLGIAHQQADCLGLQQPLALLVYRRLSDCRRFAEVEPASAHRAVDYSVDRCRSQADYDGFYAGDGFFVDVDIEYRDDADDVAGGSGGGGGVGAK